MAAEAPPAPAPHAPAQAPAAPVAPAPEVAAPAAVLVTAAVQGPTPAASPAATGAQEKERSRSALERGRVAESIAAGERAVALDPADAEAWLILGAAYQQKGDAKSAARSFKACVDQGKRGPKGECAAMLR